MKKGFIVILYFAVFCLITSNLISAQRPTPTKEELLKIKSAAPNIPLVKPKKQRALLVFTLCRGFYHNSIPYGAEGVKVMGEKTGAFTTTVTDDPSFFEPQRLDKFDAVCLMNALGEFFIPDNIEQLSKEEQDSILAKDKLLKENFMNYLKKGRGLVVIHGSSFAFPSWKEYPDIIGGFFDRHPWNGYEKLALKIDDPSHPLMRAFCVNGFEIIDEGYQFKESYSRKKVRVLMSLDLTRMDTNKANLRADRDYGISWVKRYGEGRVFHCALGHNPEEFWNPALLTHLLDGIQFALGDLDAPIEPVNQQK